MELETAIAKTDTHHRKALNMFGNDDINFDLQLEQWDVDTNELKVPEVMRIFRAWVEPWEESIRKKQDPVAETRLLEKYKDLVFHDPNYNQTYSIIPHNMEY